jgi:hypothetical protein
MSESGMKKFDPKKKAENEWRDAKRSKSLLSVPTIYVDNLETELSTLSLASSVSDLDEPLVDPETVSMIVRNVEAMEKNEEIQESSEMVEIELPKPVEIEVTKPSDFKSESPKKTHDFMHSIQEKLHDVLHHRKETEQGKSKEIFHDLKENVSGKIHQIAEKMHHFHLPHHHAEVPHDGLVAQAMQTILMEKFNIAEASTTVHSNPEHTMQKRKSSSSSLQSIKEKFNLFQRPRRSLEMPNDSTSLNSISEIHSPAKPSVIEDSSSFLELKIHDEPESKSTASSESIVTVKSLSKDDLIVENFDSILTTHTTLAKVTTIADTNTSPLHESLLSLTRKELSTSPGVKMHTRTESVGMKFSASPAKNVSSSLGKDQITTGIHRRSSDSDLSITPKGGELKG